MLQRVSKELPGFPYEMEVLHQREQSLKVEHASRIHDWFRTVVAEFPLSAAVITDKKVTVIESRFRGSVPADSTESPVLGEPVEDLVVAGNTDPRFPIWGSLSSTTLHDTRIDPIVRTSFSRDDLTGTPEIIQKVADLVNDGVVDESALDAIALMDMTHYKPIANTRIIDATPFTPNIFYVGPRVFRQLA